MKNQSKSVVLGIDLGTTLSEAAIYEADGKVKVLPNADGELLTASVVNLRDEHNPVVGTAAVNQMAFASEYTVRLIKRSIGKFDPQGHPITVFIHPDSGKAYLPEEISAMIIRYLVHSVEAGLGVKVDAVVITVPAYFEETARMATRRAGELAGVQVLSIINEPTAAGMAFGLDHSEEGVFAVYDLGGGTFDITILQINNQDFRVLATDGDRDLGGSDIDNLILEKAIAAFKAEHGIEITHETDLVTWLETLAKCEAAKKALSQGETASFMMSAQGQRLVFDVNRADFNALIAPIVEKTKTITERALAAAKLQPKEIRDVLLVGGSTRIVAVRDMLTALFGKKPRTDAKPDEAVAMGAAIYAARLGADRGLATVDSEGKKVLPPPVRMKDVSSHPLGCLAMVDGQERNCVIIPANTPLPAEREDRFTLLHPDQTEARIAVAQGPHHALPADCAIIGELILGGLPPGPLTNRIVVKYGLTTEGTLTIHAKDEISGRTTSDVKRDLVDLIQRLTQS